MTNYTEFERSANHVQTTVNNTGWYSDKIEDLAPVDELMPDGTRKTETQKLIERIQLIQQTLPEKPVNENEEVFTGAAAEYYAAVTRERRTGKRMRR